jgi:transcriptional/translational regulatory protein YebC/TACO1
VVVSDGAAEIITADADLGAVRDALSHAGLAIESAELTMTPQSETELEVEAALQIMGLVERLEELDDVQKVHSNLAFTDALMAQMEAE